MENLRLFVILAVLIAVFGSILAQNRGSSRYVPSADEYDGESTRAPRVASARGASVRRQRPTPAPEPSEADIEPQSFQHRQAPSRETTTGRRVPSRVSPPQYSPPPPPEPHLPEDPAPLLPVVAPEEPSPIQPASQEGRIQGKRRRAKKRRRPQGEILKHAEESEKQDIEGLEKSKVAVTEILDTDQKRPQSFHDNLESINIPTPNFVSSTNFEGKPYINYADNVDDSSLRDSGASQYFPPQTGTNRLPVENTEDIQSSRRYTESPASNQNVPSRRYVPPKLEVEPPSRASYVPVLPPVRVPAEEISRSPHAEFPKEKNSENIRDRHTGSSEYHSPQRTSSSRSPSLPVSDPSDTTRNSGAKPPQNSIFRSDQPNVPNRGHSEVRLPQPQELSIPTTVDKNYSDQLSYDSAEEILNRFEEDVRPNEDNIDNEKLNPTNRLPNPSESQYDSVYPSYLDENVYDRERSRNSIPSRSQEPAPLTSRNAAASHSDDRIDSEKSVKDTDNADSGRRQLTRYEPPLQRSGSKYSPEESDSPSRSRSPQQIPETPSRGRGSSRNRPETNPEASVRTRSSSRYQSESSIDTPTRTRGSQVQESSAQHPRSRNTQRYPSESLESDSRLTSRRQSVKPEVDRTPYRQIAPVSPIEEAELPQDNMRSPYAAPVDIPDEETSFGTDPVVQTLRSRPQFEVKDAPQPYLYEEPLNEELAPNTYVPEYQPPRQHDTREPVKEREQPKESTRQSHRRENVDQRTVARESQSDYRAPQHNTRSQPQYETPQHNTRSQPQRQAPQHNTRSQSQHEASQHNTRSQPQYEEPQHNTRSQHQYEERQHSSRSQHEAPQPNTRSQPQYEAPQHSTRSRSQYEEPQPNTRSQPQYDALQRGQSQTRQPSRQQSRARQEPVPAPNKVRASGGSKFSCPEPYGFFADPEQCDRYYECRNGTAYDNLCQDGLAFNEISAPKYLRCDSLRDVDCTKRPELQEAHPTTHCPRKFGLYPHETDCTKFWNCVDGSATEVQCPPGLIYNDDRATCDWADLVKTSCKTEDLLGFTCPEPNTFDLQDGVYTSYPHPDNCQLHFVCIKGTDGTRRPRLLSCNEGLVYSPESSSCSRPDDVPGCENFYGSRSPAPKRKPSREPLPREPEELEEEPKPRRAQNRRTRN